MVVGIANDILMVSQLRLETRAQTPFRLRSNGAMSTPLNPSTKLFKDATTTV